MPLHSAVKNTRFSITRLPMFVQALLVLSVLGIASSPAFAQATSGTILGTVEDPSGGAIPNAVVIVSNTGVVSFHRKNEFGTRYSEVDGITSTDRII